MFIYFSKPFDIQEPVVFICVVWFFARLESRVPCSPKEELHQFEILFVLPWKRKEVLHALGEEMQPWTGMVLTQRGEET